MTRGADADAPVPPVVEVQGLSVLYRTGGPPVRAVHDVSLRLEEGEVLGLVGESGSGKTTLASAILGMLPGNARIESGGVRFSGQDLLAATPRQRRRIRGGPLALVPQNPMTSLNPVLTVGFQLTETIRAHSSATRPEAAHRAREALERVGVPDAARALRRYPHEFSGGTRQRILIALALANGPRALVADEPTSALDATIQRQIVELLGQLVASSRLSLLLISHDFGVVAALATRICVMYGGEVVEQGPADEVLAAPSHPYTAALLAAATGEPPAIVDPPAAAEPGSGCRFLARCPAAVELCRSEPPPLFELAPSHRARCFVARDRSGS